MRSPALEKKKNPDANYLMSDCYKLKGGPSTYQRPCYLVKFLSFTDLHHPLDDDGMSEGFVPAVTNSTGTQQQQQQNIARDRWVVF